jgi:hypothetical protein
MTDELSYEAAELFRSARTGLSPSGEDLSRGRRRLAAAVAAGGVSLGAAGTAKAGGLGSSFVLAALVAGGVAAGGATWWSRSRPVEATAPAIVLPALEVPAAPNMVAAEVAPPVPMPGREVAAPVVAPVRRSPPPAIQASPVQAAPQLEEAAPVEQPPAAPVDGLARELELVRSADAALRAGDAARALTIARADNVVQLAAELSAIEIDALCSLQRHDEARERVLAFRHRFPYSALAARVARSCEGGAR